MALQTRIYNFTKRFDKPIAHFANVLTVLSFFGGAAIWLFDNLDGFWPLITAMALIAALAMAARMRYLQIQLAEIDKAVNRLLDSQSEIMSSGLRDLIASKPKIVSFADFTSAVHSLKEAGADPKAVDNMISEISRIERLQRQQKPDE